MTIKSVVLLIATCFAVSAQTEPPIACNMRALNTEQRKQLSAYGDQIVAAVAGTRELPDGYSFRLDPARTSVLDVARMLDLWRRCCPFYEFRVDLHAADGGMWLSVTGRPGVKEYFPVDAPKLAAKLPHAMTAHPER